MIQARIDLHGFGWVVWVRHLYAPTARNLVGKFASSNEAVSTRFPWMARLLDEFERENLCPAPLRWHQYVGKLRIAVIKELARFFMFGVIVLAMLFFLGWLLHNGYVFLPEE